MENTRNTGYKYCVVPLCTSSTVKNPDKIFIRVPEDKKRRIKWLKACRRYVGDYSTKTTHIRVCEDHFNIAEDMDKYVKFKLMGGKKIMKSHVVPHIFDCQPDRKRTFSVPPRSAAVNRIKRRLVDEAVATCSTTTIPGILQTSVSPQSDPQPITDMAMDLESVDATLPQTSIPLKRDVSVQAHRRVMFRSKAVQCKINLGVNVSLSPIKIYNKDITKKQETNLLKNIYDSPFSVKSSENRFNEDDSDSDFLVVSEARSSHSEVSEELSDEKKNSFKSICLSSTIMKLENRPRLYLGLPDDAYYVVHLLEKYCKIESMYIYIFNFKKN
ncbi:uncharacterized protein LOC115883783 [Sitophilus oryzae]|uniref:Uncharacterized protein LOC115883783 n=1 Tax=Sitophilus oryzae TaxID=7048 RepID=A0A6J2Y4Y2_SITOR|nr:uncharacterized protein LOC115883783 [Sitophilus oryzae]